MNMINYQFKILYAIGIIFVVMGHCTYAGFGLFTDWFALYAFHLGLFVFCSGYFYKDTSHQNILAYIWKKLKTLIFPLYAWNAIYAVIIKISTYFGFTIGGEITLSKLLVEPITSGHQFAYNMGGWFVIPLFMIELFNVIVRKLIDLPGIRKLKSKNYEFFICICYVLMGIAGNCMAQNGWNTGWWLVLARMLHFLPFFGIGTLYKRRLEKHDTINNTVYFTGLILIQLIIILLVRRVPTCSQAWLNNFPEGPVLPVIEGFLGIAFWLRIAKVVESILKDNKLVLLIANNTFAIMIHQFMGFMLVKTVFAIFYRAGLCASFDWEAYKSDIWYYYFPGGMEQAGIFYIAAGILLPIAIQTVCSKIKSVLLSQKNAIYFLKFQRNN